MLYIRTPLMRNFKNCARMQQNVCRLKEEIAKFSVTLSSNEDGKNIPS